MVFIDNMEQQITHGGCKGVVLDTGIGNVIEVIEDYGVV